MNAQLSHAEAQDRLASRQKMVPSADDPSGRRIIIALSVCMALQMTSFVIIMPLFARRFSELGAGVESLGLSAMAYALAGTLAAPFMGALADRFGRRRLVLTSLAAYILAFTGYLVVSSAPVFILLRGLAGAFTAGLIPTATAIVADLAPIDRRAQWIGFMNGGASIGWIAGPILGGVLYDHWGYNIALVVAIIMAATAFITALVTIPETRRTPGSTTGTARGEQKLQIASFGSGLQTLRTTLPSSLSTFTVLLGITLATMFAWALIEPRFMFYAYDDLGWSSSMLGLVMSTYGVAVTFGEFFLSQLSDRLGRKPVIMCGLVLFAAQFIGLALSQSYILIAAAFVIAGLGNALFDPALSASILDIAPPEHQSRILGLKSTASSLGSILGPALVVLFTPFVDARGVFLAATGIVFISVLICVPAQMKTRQIRKDSPPAEIDGGI